MKNFLWSKNFFPIVSFCVFIPYIYVYKHSQLPKGKRKSAEGRHFASVHKFAKGSLLSNY